MSELNSREQSLVALGAAIAANCIPCIEFHVPEARRAGLKDPEIREAVEIADKVRRVPANLVMQSAMARLDVSPSDPGRTTDPGCGCAGPRETGCAG